MNQKHKFLVCSKIIQILKEDLKDIIYFKIIFFGKMNKDYLHNNTTLSVTALANLKI